jgi:UDP-N-acetylmuramoyl-tripeptide--D-alanyl-D-alanine ligase
MEPSGVAVINADDRFSSYWLARTRRYKTMTFGLDSQADVQGKIEFIDNGLDLEIQLPDDRFDVRLNLLGKHNARNALAAATVAWTLGIDYDRIKSGLQKVQPINGRLQPRVAKNNANLIDDSYNANPASLRSAIRVLARKDGHRILVIGDMAELGSESENFHRAAGRYAREKGIQQLFTLGNLAAFSAEEFGVGAIHFKSFEELSEKLLHLLAPDMHVLVKGSRSARMERVVDTLLQLEAEVD